MTDDKQTTAPVSLPGAGEPEEPVKQDAGQDTSRDAGQNHRPALTIDYALYESYLEDSDMSDAQKREFIETLWSIVVSFVDLGFGVHALQLACEQTTDKGGDTRPDLLSSWSNTNAETAKPADPPNDDHAERKET